MFGKHLKYFSKSMKLAVSEKLQGGSLNFVEFWDWHKL